MTATSSTQARQQRHQLDPRLSALRRHDLRLGAASVTGLFANGDESVTA